MKDIEKLISPLIESQFPSVYRDEGATFVAFVKAYFEWLEQTNGVAYDSRRLPEYRDIDTTLDKFVDEFRKKYMHGIPKDIAADKRLLQKHIKELYSSKGTERGLELLFRILFNEDINVYIPGADVLRASDAQWLVPRYLELEYNVNIGSYVGKTITGRISGATAFVDEYKTFVTGNKRHDILYITDIVGTFAANEEIINTDVIDDLGIEVTSSPRVRGSLIGIDVRGSSTGFSLGEVVDVSGVGEDGQAIVTSLESLQGVVSFDIINGGTGFTLTASETITPSGNAPSIAASFNIGSLSNTSTIDLTSTPITNALSIQINAPAPAYTAFSANAAADWLTPFNGIFVLNTYTYGTIATLTDINPGKGYNANVAVSVVDNLIYPLRISDGAGGFLGYNANIAGFAGIGDGAAKTVAIYNSGFGYTNNTTVSLTSVSNSSHVATGTINAVGQGKGEGYFKSTRGFLNSDKYIHDNYYYQEYSYEVQAVTAFNKYSSILRDLWHPAGMEKFGRTLIQSVPVSRGTTLEALIEYLDTQYLTSTSTTLTTSTGITTSRFTETVGATTIATEYLTTSAYGTSFITKRETAIDTTFETAISTSTLTAFSTLITTATAIDTAVGTIFYTNTTYTGQETRATATTKSTATVYDTNRTTTFATAYATGTSKTTTTSYATLAGVSATNFQTSVVTNFFTTTVFDTSITADTTYETFASASGFVNQIRAIEDAESKGFLSNPYIFWAPE